MQVSPWAAPPICAMSDSSWLKRRSSKGWWKPQGPGTSMANLKTKKSCLESFRYDWVIRISVEPGGFYIRYKPTKSRFLWFNDSIVFQPGSMDRLSHSTPAVPLERQMWAPKPETAHILSTWIVGIRTITTKEWQIPSPKKKLQHIGLITSLTLGKLHYQPPFHATHLPHNSAPEFPGHV